MRPVWYHIAKMKAQSRLACPPPREPGRINCALEWLRTRRTYHAVAGIVQRKIEPILFIVAIGFGGTELLLNVPNGMSHSAQIKAAR